MLEFIWALAFDLERDADRYLDSLWAVLSSLSSSRRETCRSGPKDGPPGSPNLSAYPASRSRCQLINMLPSPSHSLKIAEAGSAASHSRSVIVAIFRERPQWPSGRRLQFGTALGCARNGPLRIFLERRDLEGNAFGLEDACQWREKGGGKQSLALNRESRR